MPTEISNLPPPVNGVPFAPDARSGVSTGASLSETFDSFLNLLTTQLQNQDPLEPTDADRFTEQLVQFSGVEQSILTNQRLEELINLQGGNLLNDAVNYIGREVTADSLLVPLQDGRASLNYELASNAEAVSVQIINSAGQTIRTLTGPTTFGAHEIEWDGADENGGQLEDGTYGFLVTATDADSNPISLVQGISGQVTGVGLDGNEVLLSLGSLELPLGDVLNVRAAAHAPAGS